MAETSTSEMTDTVHIERTNRRVKRAFTDEQRTEYASDLTHATLMIRELSDAKSNSTKSYNEEAPDA